MRDLFVCFPEYASTEGAITIAMETLRVHRPRVILHGPSGMGQAYVAAAALHYLEGYHVQTLDVANLMSDSTRVSNTRRKQLISS